MNKIYQGESLCMVFKCHEKDGTPVDMGNAGISVILRDVAGEVAYRFSTRAVENVKPVQVDGSYIICRLSEIETSVLSGAYVVEVKVRKNDLVTIDITKKIKIYNSVIGEDTGL